jgi:predicted AlkP superfamily phosphohydrolase/phosphomutase/tetratricopeptide (TPR) repeat protein
LPGRTISPLPEPVGSISDPTHFCLVRKNVFPVKLLRMKRVAPDTKVLLIGWDAADWKIIHRLVDEGKMPNMARFIEGGIIGNLATLSPELSPMLWTSIATGKRPFKHGILGFVEPDPHGGGIRPITNISRKTKAIWNILGQAGRKCNIIGWWPSHPVEPISGVMVSNHYHRAVAPYGKPWPIEAETIHPRRLIRNLAALRVHPQELDPGLIMNFVPRLSEIDQEKDHRVENLAKIIADCTTINRAATALMHHEPWDLTAVYFDGIDHFCHGYMHYHPPRLSWVNEKDYDLYKEVVESGYRYHDILLGTLLEEAGENATVIIVSDHGFHSDHLRPKNIPIEPAGPAVQHRPYGIFAARGPGIVKDEIIYGASLLDICPTVLSIFGLPVGEDMDGKPLLNIFAKNPGITTVPSWDEIPGDDGGHPADKKIDPAEAREAIRQLVALGYIEEPSENKEKAARECVRELQYNHARSLMDAGLHGTAVPILKELIEQWPEEHRFGIQLVNCYQCLGKIAEARSLLEEVFRRKKKDAREATVKLREAIEARKDPTSKELSRKEQQEMRNLRARASRSAYAMEYLMGSLLYAEGKKQEALDHLMKAEKADAKQPDLHVKLGDVYLKMKQLPDAERSYRKALAIDPESADAYAGLSQVYLRMRKNSEACDAALSAVGLRYHYPKAHFLLGISLHRTGMIEAAIEAFNISVTQNPCYTEAYRRLAYLYRHRLGDRTAAGKYEALAQESSSRIRLFKSGKIEKLAEKEADALTSLTSSHRSFRTPEGPPDLRKTVIVVSGLPRSGTSMMMQMLNAGGLPPLTDGKRVADPENPRGYFEYEKATQLRSDASWVPEARGKAVKIVAQLLRDLPERNDTDYLVIFMERDIREVIMSQKAMLSRQGKKGALLADERLKYVFSRQMLQAKLALSARKIPVVFFDYNRTVQDPADTASRLKAVLGDFMDETAMARAVEPSLKRQG